MSIRRLIVEVSSEPWFVAKKRFGGELDLLAIDPRGRLLVVEVKPGSATDGITWAPLQATFYAELFRAWSDEVGSDAGTILLEMLQQRIDLKLTVDPMRELADPLEIVPVVATGGEMSKNAAPRMWKVDQALLDGGVGWANLEVWYVRESVSREMAYPA